jgi:hypothetical protein
MGRFGQIMIYFGKKWGRFDMYSSPPPLFSSRSKLGKLYSTSLSILLLLLDRVPVLLVVRETPRIKKNHMCSHIFIIHNDHTYITEDYTSNCKICVQVNI